MRQEEDFIAGHLPGAYNVPLDEILERGFELPPRSEPMVVCCSEEDFSRTSDWFETRHDRCRWQVEVLPMTPQLLASRPPENGRTPPGRFLFAPSPLLAQSSPLLQRLLADSAAAGIAPRALDVGAGSGRDAATLAVQGWHVTCLDREHRALRRCESLAKRHAFSERCCTVQANLKQAGDLLDVTREHRHEHGGWHAIIVNRHLHRPTLLELGQLLRPGGVLLFHTFLVGNSHPSDEQSVLQLGELRETFGPTLTVERDEELRIEDGRLLTFFVARRPLKAQACHS